MLLKYEAVNIKKFNNHATFIVDITVKNSAPAL